jgi:hypothetical protein
LARQIMSCDRLTSARIDELTDALRRLLDTVPETLQFNDTWMYPETNLPDLYAIAIGTYYSPMSSLRSYFPNGRLLAAIL